VCAGVIQNRFRTQLSQRYNDDNPIEELLGTTQLKLLDVNGSTMGNNGANNLFSGIGSESIPYNLAKFRDKRKPKLHMFTICGFPEKPIAKLNRNQRPFTIIVPIFDGSECFQYRQHEHNFHAHSL